MRRCRNNKQKTENIYKIIEADRNKCKFKKTRRVNSTCHKVSIFLYSFQIILSKLLPTLCRELLRKRWQDLCEQVAHFHGQRLYHLSIHRFNYRKNIINKRSHSLMLLWPPNEKDKEMRKERQGRE